MSIIADDDKPKDRRTRIWILYNKLYIHLKLHSDSEFSPRLIGINFTYCKCAWTVKNAEC